MKRTNFNMDRKDAGLRTADCHRQKVEKPSQVRRKHLLLRHPNFVSDPETLSFGTQPLACEASALATELTVPFASFQELFLLWA
jgi:hypothetical protein